MSGAERVVWTEGLFLRAHHLQQQDRHTEALVRGAMQASGLQTYGFRSLVLDRAALDAGSVGIEAARGVLPDGTPFSIPDDAPAPEAVRIAADTPAGLVRLALPLETTGGTTVDPAHAEPSGARYRGAIRTVRDVVRDGADPEEIEVARLAPLLLRPGEEPAGHAALAVARIEGLRPDGGVALAEGHLPPALVTAAAPWYGRLLREVVTGLDGIAEAHGRMVRGGAGRSVENLLILELANAARPRLSHMLAQDLFHPAELFLELAGLAGRMATYGSSARRLSELPAYDHADPQMAFAALADTLRSLMLTLRHVEPKSQALPVARHSQNVWTVRLDDPDVVRSRRIVLRVGSEMSEEALRRLFVQQVTVGSDREFNQLWTSKLKGIPLKPLHSQPREIPYDGDRLCLELDRASDHWPSLADARGFVVGVAGEIERDPTIDCYAVSR